MFQQVERYLNFIVKYKLTQSQFLFLYLLYRKKTKLIPLYKEAFPTEDGTMIGKNLMKDLIDREFLIYKGNGTTDIKDYEITEKFYKYFISDAYNASAEIWDRYPGFVKINGVDTPLTTMDRYQFAINYCERIDYSVEEHREVIKDVEFGRARGLIRMKIENFVNSNAWEKLRPIRLNEEQIIEISDNTNL